MQKIDTKGILSAGDDDFIYGIHPVLEKLRASPQQVRRIVLQARKANPQVQQIIDLAKQKGVEIFYDERKGRIPSSQGVLAEVEPFTYSDIHQLPVSDGPMDAILALDGVTDPRNLGAILRVAEAVRLRAVVISRNRSAEITPLVVKAASGAVSYLKVCRVRNLRETLRELKRTGYWIVGLDENSEEGLLKIPYPDRVVLVAGSEGSGIRRLVKEECDWTTSIPVWGHVHSLNVSVAVGVALYLLIASRRAKEESTDEVSAKEV
jgi:23S rRNA (guanosine2251-2'-O)-methyltransferase